MNRELSTLYCRYGQPLKVLYNFFYVMLIAYNIDRWLELLLDDSSDKASKIKHPIYVFMYLLNPSMRFFQNESSRRAAAVPILSHAGS